MRGRGDEQTQARPIPHDELVRLQRCPREARGAADLSIRCGLFGHAISRECYGDGASFEMQRDLLLLIALWELGGRIIGGMPGRADAIWFDIAIVFRE